MCVYIYIHTNKHRAIIFLHIQIHMIYFMITNQHPVQDYSRGAQFWCRRKFGPGESRLEGGVDYYGFIRIRHHGITNTYGRHTLWKSVAENYGKSPWLMGKLTISITIFHSSLFYVSLPEVSSKVAMSMKKTWWTNGF